MGKQATDKIRALGICIGASTISAVQVETHKNEDKAKWQKPVILEYSIHPHEGDPKQTIVSIFKDLEGKHFDRVAGTGRMFRNFVNLSSITEPEAVEYAYKFAKPQGVSCPAVVSAGGETFMVYALNNFGKISNVFTGSKCASGTGEFFLQQLRRMDVSLEEAAMWASVEEPYKVSGRCSVFCKSDCTHATNKGVQKSKVASGLCRMIADKILNLLKKVEKRNIMFTGGTMQNRMITEYLDREIQGMIIPETAPCFEALGAALWALEHETPSFPGISELFKVNSVSFDMLPRLTDFESMVEFKTVRFGTVQNEDRCILGLDVGSTTTKAVLMRDVDDAILAWVYLRTNGDPVEAARQCYQSILNQITKKVDPEDISIVGLGVCGSGRQIAGVHAFTKGVVNEIIAHATAAVHFDRQVDTIFEIGGQDAKYTYITNSVPSDYAMNEACSAGTGSFLEESAHETLGIKMTDIAGIALRGTRPPNFNDQCAAFISSDIKNAIHEGIEQEDIVAGLVYSICMNYSNRVRGNRPVGNKVFMQGGVCYNKAVPIAMAALLGKPIVVPPEPGLMGAYGSALAIQNKIRTGLMEEKKFDLSSLAGREVFYEKPFICGGDTEGCDRKCEIAVINIEGNKHPFGGACNRYYNLRNKLNVDTNEMNLVRMRQHLVFEKYAACLSEEKRVVKRGVVGINRSFQINTYYPLFSTFFSELGFKIVMPDRTTQEGAEKLETQFCFPAELAHGFFDRLLKTKDHLDFIFLPHLKAIPSLQGYDTSQVCPIVQAEPFYLKAAFREKIDELKGKGTKVLTPMIDMTGGEETILESMVEISVRMGVNRNEAQKAFAKAVQAQKACMREMKVLGEKALSKIAADPDKIAVVIFARPYNGFAEEAHMGIPNKLASRGVQVIPFDFLPVDDEPGKPEMYWGPGQALLKAGRFVKKHPRLFGAYITNFSCGPDSFIVGYLRDIMEQKPTLTLELDSHTADAGLETRIEAFLDIIDTYRQLESTISLKQSKPHFLPARAVLDEGTATIITSSNEQIPAIDPRVTVLIPSMGDLSSESIAAVCRSVGFNAKASPPADEAVLKLGRANTSCKECLPLIITAGSLLNYAYNKKQKDEILLYFMPTASGPCRFGQYFVFMEGLIKKLELTDVALISLSSENSYLGLDNSFHIRSWWAIIIADVMEDVRSMILANAKNTKVSMEIFTEEWAKVLVELEKEKFSKLLKQLAKTAHRLKNISLKKPPETVPTILLTGEIFVRRDAISRQDITQNLAKMGFATVCSPISEWVHYCDYLVDEGINGVVISKFEKLNLLFRKKLMHKYEKDIKSVLCRSGLVMTKPVNIRTVVKNATPYMSHNLTGEAILTIGSTLTDIASHVCGVIAIGPFGCMPNRIAEAILAKTVNRKCKLATAPRDQLLKERLKNFEDLPFFAVETDGSTFPHLVQAKLETFCLRANRLHESMLSSCNGMREKKVRIAVK